MQARRSSWGRWSLHASTIALAIALAGASTAHAEPGAEAPKLPGPAVTHDVRFDVPDVKDLRLSNGIRVLFVERHDVPLFSVHVLSTVGAADAPPGVAELASRSAVSSAYHSYWMRTSHKFNLIGAKLSAYADHRMVGVSTHAMSTRLEDAIADLGEVARVQFPDGDIVRQARDEAIDALDRAESSSANYAARELLYPASHPYHYAETGTTGAIRALDAASLRTFWSRAFTAANVTITASGDVSVERLTKALEAAFGALPRGTVIPPSAPLAAPLDARKAIVLIDERGTSQARVSIVSLGVPRRDPDYDALSVATHLVDEMLDERVRKTYGSSYGVYASLEQERGTPPLWIHGSIENGGVGKAISTILGALTDVSQGHFSDDDLARARLSRFQQTARAFETSTSTADLLASSASLGLGVADLRAIPARTQAVTRERIHEVAAEHLDPARTRVVVVGDLRLLTPELEKAGLGPFEVRGGPPVPAKPAKAPPVAKR
jgi:zinc protease